VKLRIARLAAQLTNLSLIVLFIGHAVPAQQMIGAKAGIISFVRDRAFLDNKPLRITRGDYVQMKNGQLLSTKQGRIELLLSPGTYFRMGENGSLRMIENSLDGTQLNFEKGSALVEVVEKVKSNPIRINLSAGVIEIKEPGLYRLESSPPEIRVYGGDAIVLNGNNKIKAKEGWSIRLDANLAQSLFDLRNADALHRWAAERSLAVFVANPNNRNVSNWRPEGIGELKSPNYRMRFRTNVAWIRNWQIQQIMKAAYEERALENFMRDQMERIKREAEIQENAKRRESAKQPN
jgi:hypothetical protein